MAHAYTPGLKVLEKTIVTKDRRLPLPGTILVEQESKVSATQVVAQTKLPGNVQTVNVAGLLGILPEEVESAMLKKAGEKVTRDEVIAQSKGFFGLLKSKITSPVDGEIESISQITGQVILREPPVPVEVIAYIDGKAIDIFPNEGVKIETMASFIQGIFGIGGEMIGELMSVASDPNAPLTPPEIDEKCRGKILIGGSIIDSTGLEKAVRMGVKGIVIGGIEDKDLKKFLGYDIGVAITGSEKRGLTLIVTEGFGRLRMADRTFKLLNSLVGKQASINGATQIRAGVIRPEVIVPYEITSKSEIKKSSLQEVGLVIGTPIRVIREPYFGQLGTVTNLPAELQIIETEAKVRVLEVELEDKRRVILPRANVEIIES